MTRRTLISWKENPAQANSLTMVPRSYSGPNGLALVFPAVPCAFLEHKYFTVLINFLEVVNWTQILPFVFGCHDLAY